jgi:hypothetical protein
VTHRQGKSRGLCADARAIMTRYDSRLRWGYNHSSWVWVLPSPQGLVPDPPCLSEFLSKKGTCLLASSDIVRQIGLSYLPQKCRFRRSRLPTVSIYPSIHLSLSLSLFLSLSLSLSIYRAYQRAAKALKSIEVELTVDNFDTELGKLDKTRNGTMPIGQKNRDKICEFLSSGLSLSLSLSLSRARALSLARFSLSLSLSILVCMRACLRKGVCEWVWVWVCVCVCVYVCMYVYVYLCAFSRPESRAFRHCQEAGKSWAESASAGAQGLAAGMGIHTHACTHKHTVTHTHTYIYIYIYIYKYIYIYIFIYI